MIQKVQCIRQNHIVVDAEVHVDDVHGDADAAEEGRHSPASQRARRRELPDGHLEKNERYADHNQKEKVRYEKNTASVLVA